MARLILITGCSGAGKSSLLSALGALGHAIVEEPGRRIVAEETATAGRALPWIDPAGFAKRALEMARVDLSAATPQSGTVFFDRGVIDAAVGLQHTTGVPLRETLAGVQRYNNPVFLAPPWPEIYVNDDDRRHDLSAGIEEYHRLQSALGELDYEVSLLPKTSVEQRVAFVLDRLKT